MIACASACHGFWKASDLYAAVGPHIQADRYHVGEEFGDRFPVETCQRREDGYHLDLGAEARRQLEEAGLQPNRIAVSSNCTAGDTDSFFSYRRDGRMMRMLAFLKVPEPSELQGHNR